MLMALLQKYIYIYIIDNNYTNACFMISSTTISDHDVNGHRSGSNGNGMQSLC